MKLNFLTNNYFSPFVNDTNLYKAGIVGGGALVGVGFYDGNTYAFFVGVAVVAFFAKLDNTKEEARIERAISARQNELERSVNSSDN